MNHFSTFHLTWKRPEFILLFIRPAMIGEKQFAAIFMILGPMPSSPVALDGSKEPINDKTCSVVIEGISK